ncbi:GIN domain-containing protein [Sphingomonas oligophenolica]|uniref:DUF2807 domain-containing protein n=1 Tax=Sphingomonas oligophenolica TaxID=301154 RepID=A0A502CPS8_9SPHN|nr:DUF2807 domain-containing protein [Sphingomonas oligophenolica]TPG15645.1 DUF2807 domain-containing protein [Sphingomonas oligophenolica]
MTLSLRLAVLALSCATATASAADRPIYIGSFDRVRVQGPFEVRIVNGSPGATLSGDRRVIEGVEVRVDGSTLTIRNGFGQWGEQPRASTTQPVVVTLRTRNVVHATVIGAGRLTIPRMKATRVELAVTGAGVIIAGGIDADQANATVIGGGAITLAGRATSTRLIANGPATIDAGALAAGDATVRVDGPGEVKANARFTATVDNLGLGQVTVAGHPKCSVKANAGGPVTCGGGA